MKTPRKSRYAAITPYYKEEPHFLERCMSSVRHQTYDTDHFLISDGFAQDWIDKVGVRHIRLGVAHGDYGNTPRGIGGLLAASEHYDGIFFLDADNWLEPNHVEHCVRAAETKFGNALDCDLVIARRTFRRPDASIMPIAEEPDHVDTNCLFFLPGAYDLLSIWVTMPKMMSSLGDRYFYRLLSSKNLNMAQCLEPTVNYHCIWAVLYQMLGEELPEGAKETVQSNLWEAVRQMSPRELEIARRQSGGFVFSNDHVTYGG